MAYTSGAPEFYDITSTPTFISTGPQTNLTSAVFGLNSHQDVLFAIVGSGTLYCFDTSSLGSVTSLSSKSVSGSAHTVLGHDGVDALYLGNANNQLRAVSVRDTTNPIAP